MPSRDDLTAAWGDVILPGLRAPVRAFMASGRFVAVEGDQAVFAVPDRPLVSRAATVKGEAEQVLSSHFGRPVSLRLIHEPGSAPPPPVLADDPSAYDLTDLADAEVTAVSPEQRLMEVFPGAQEVKP